MGAAGSDGPEQDHGAFKASDVLKLAGLTYRQLNDWENRAGVLASERATVDGWRKFTGEEVLALCVCAHLRRQLSVTLDRLGQVYRWLVGQKPDRVCSALADVAEFTLRNMDGNEKITRLLALRGDAKLASLGLPVYLCTAFESSLILQEANLVRWVAMRAAREPTIVYPLNEIINAFVGSVGGEAFGLDTAMPSFMEYWSKLQEQADVSISEREALRLIRERAYQRVTLHVQGGQIVQIDTQEDIAVGSEDVREKVIIELIKSEAYQTVEIMVQDGRTVALHRKVVTKVPSGRGKNPNR